MIETLAEMDDAQKQLLTGRGGETYRSLLTPAAMHALPLARETKPPKRENHFTDA
jgi:hypothetical protein